MEEAPLEILDKILYDAMKGDILTQAVISFVCPLWWERKATLLTKRRWKLREEARGPLGVEAVRSGNLSLLMWLRDMGCPAWRTTLTMAEAAAAGSIPMLEWLKEAGSTPGTSRPQRGRP